jgi:hypothetical protein
MINIRKVLWLVVAGSALSSCATEFAKRVAKPEMLPPTAVAWNQRQPIVSPDNVGYLRVETDMDVRVGGGQGRIYLKCHRPYDIYADDGRLLREDVDNGAGDGRGESCGQPRTVALAPGRYVVASVYGTTYRKVQIEIRAGRWTEVTDDLLRNATPVPLQRNASAPTGAASNQEECCHTQPNEPHSGSVSGTATQGPGVAGAPPGTASH